MEGDCDGSEGGSAVSAVIWATALQLAEVSHAVGAVKRRGGSCRRRGSRVTAPIFEVANAVIQKQRLDQRIKGSGLIWHGCAKGRVMAKLPFTFVKDVPELNLRLL